jgi:hypothetical protein
MPYIIKSHALNQHTLSLIAGNRACGEASQSSAVRRLALFAAVCLLNSLADGLAANSNLTWKADLALKEAYDSNVYLQDKEPNPTVLNAVPAKKDSWVTTVTPRLSLDYRPCSAFDASLSYAPDMAIYHNAHSEDYFAHRFGLTLSGKADDLTWEQANAFTYIDGNHLSPTFGRPQDIPAIGGAALRDRRDSTVYRGSFKLTYSVGDFFLRPVSAAYIHDFHTLQQPSANPAVYENYVDRQDVNGGLDIGYDVGKENFLVVGYRYGQQDQFKQLGVDSPFDSSYNRVLFGVEGAPLSWLKVGLLGGPDFRSWASGTPRGFDREKVYYWMDASLTLLPSSQDSIVLLSRRYLQPAFGNVFSGGVATFSVYEDITYSAAWKHKFSDHWAGSAGFQLYIGKYRPPTLREDWIYTPSAALTYTHDQHLSAELSYSYDWVENQKAPVVGTPTQFADGREYTRHIVSLGVKYAFSGLRLYRICFLPRPAVLFCRP